jgi:hypothetical protein
LGLAVINSMVGIKIAWTFVIFTRDAALAHLAAALGGLAACDAILLGWWYGAPGRKAMERRL